MFSKSYKLKSNNTLKNSEKKHLAQKLVKSFPGATEENIKELVPLKANITCMKLILHSEDMLSVYVVENVPVAIEKSEMFHPTVCALWKIPNLVPMITTQAAVLSKLQNGAPLYLPGIQTCVGESLFPVFKRGASVAVNTDDNSAAAAIGSAVMSSAQMLGGTSGVALEVHHFIGDHLCKENKFNKIERPKLGPPTYSSEAATNLASQVNQLAIHQQEMEKEWPSLGGSSRVAVENKPKVISETPTEVPEEVPDDSLPDNSDVTIDEEPADDGIPSDMDSLLKFCLLSFIKLEGKKVELPLKTNLLYMNHLIRLCPPMRTLDVKKSSYKKMRKFLAAMQEEGLIEVKEIEKGVDAVTSITTVHELLRTHVAIAPAACPTESTDDQYTPPLVREMFCVTAAVAPLLAPLKKGTALPASEIRATLTQYIRSRGLQHVASPGRITMDAALSQVTGKAVQEAVSWEVLMSAVQAKMTPCTQMQFSDGTVRTTKTKLEPVKMQVATRSGNKKVTLVSNLEAFGFNLQELSKVCQHGVAASSSVTRTPGSKGDQLMVQGDQTYFIAKLLIEKYGLPKKFVEGADKALKKKNK